MSPFKTARLSFVATFGKRQHTATRLCRSAVITLAFAAINAVNAQVSTINSVNVLPRFYNDVAAAKLTVVTNYPSLISFNEQNVSAAAGFANRDVWHFSSDGGVTASQFQNTDYFQVSMDVTLTGSPSTPRKEAGFVFNNPAADGGEFIINTDAHEVVAFGGFLPFYAFPKFFNSGATVTLGITIFRDGNGKNAIIYSANGTNSPALEFSNTEQGVINNTTIGGYFQIQQDSANASNSGSAAFANLKFTPQPQIASSGNQLVVYWPASGTNFVLQTATNLSSANWLPVTNGARIIGVTVTNGNPAAFFRLQAMP